jgi:hypothetical protein
MAFEFDSTLEDVWNHPFSDADLVAPLLAALNNEKMPFSTKNTAFYLEPRAVTRVKKLIDALQQMSAFSSHLRKLRDAGKSDESKLDELRGRANELLAIYRMQPGVGWFPKRGVWVGSYVHFASRARNRERGRRGLDERSMIRPVLELLEQGKMARIKRCGNERCSRWFYALLSHQRFCNSKCKRKYHESTPEFKAHRRAYMRARYQQLEKKSFPTLRARARKKEK